MCVPGSLRKKALPRAQQDRVNDQQDFIRKPMFEQRRCQRGATREDKVRAPFKTFRTVGRDLAAMLGSRHNRLRARVVIENALRRVSPKPSAEAEMLAAS